MSYLCGENFTDMEKVDTQASKVKKETADKKSKETLKTRRLFVKTLKTLGCQPKVVEEDDNGVEFAFQWEEFMAYVKGWWIEVWDYNWEVVELDDIEDFSRLRKAINIANFDGAVTTVYEVDKENGRVYLHAKLAFVLAPEIPSLDTYLYVQIVRFFYPHRIVELEMERMRRDEGAFN